MFTKIPKATPITKRSSSFKSSEGPVFPNEIKCEIKTESIAMAEIQLRHWQTRIKIARYRKKTGVVKPRRLKSVIEIAKATAKARKRARAVRRVSFFVGCTERIATIPAETEKSSLSACAQRIARAAAIVIFIVFAMMGFIQRKV